MYLNVGNVPYATDIAESICREAYKLSHHIDDLVVEEVKEID